MPTEIPVQTKDSGWGDDQYFHSRCVLDDGRKVTISDYSKIPEPKRQCFACGGPINEEDY
jgi:hypothetical protein